MELDLSNLYKVDKKNGLTAKKLVAQKAKIKKYLKSIDDSGQGFYKVISEKRMVDEILSFTKMAQGKFDDIVVLGIGGSALGTIFLQHALYKKDGKNPRLHVIDNIDSNLIDKVEQEINYKKTLFIAVSKSGQTTEIIGLLSYFYQKVKNKKLKIKDHFVFVTNSESGLLRRIADKQGIVSFNIPLNVGGRFSVLTAVGLLPASLIGVDIKKILMGARSMRTKFLSLDFKKNLPFKLAAIQHLLDEKGKNINVLMPYANRLNSFSDWFKQLLAESIGKAEDRQGKIVHTGITPTKALGATDQHSQSQLFNEGPNNKLIIFIKVDDHQENFKKNKKIPAVFSEKEAELLRNLDFNKLMNISLQATADSYTRNNRPSITISIKKIDEKTMGELIMLFEGATAFLGEFKNINAFDQPGVELSKKLVKKYLKKK